MPATSAELAEKMLLQSPPIFEVLRIYEFRDYVEPHKDDLQGRLEREFHEAFVSELNCLRARFREPSILDAPSSDLPINAFRSAVWHIEEEAISLAASHEDRECPYVLLLSVTCRKTQ